MESSLSEGLASLPLGGASTDSCVCHGQSALVVGNGLGGGVAGEEAGGRRAAARGFGFNAVMKAKSILLALFDSSGQWSGLVAAFLKQAQHTHHLPATL